MKQPHPSRTKKEEECCTTNKWMQIDCLACVSGIKGSLTTSKRHIIFLHRTLTDPLGQSERVQLPADHQSFRLCPWNSWKVYTYGEVYIDKRLGAVQVKRSACDCLCVHLCAFVLEFDQVKMTDLLLEFSSLRWPGGGLGNFAVGFGCRKAPRFVFGLRLRQSVMDNGTLSQT